MVKNSLMLFSSLFSQSLSKLIVGHTFSQSLSKLVIGYTTPQSLPARPAPYQPHTPHPTPLLLRVDSDEMRQNRKVLALRCWNARKGPRMGPKVHEVDSARSSKQGSSLLEVGLLRARAQTKVDEVYGPYGSSPNPAKFAPSKFPQTLKYFRKPRKW